MDGLFTATTYPQAIVHAAFLLGMFYMLGQILRGK